MREADRWLGFARQDLRVAELALDDNLYNQVCFHSQQCVEKVLKAWLVDKGEKTPRTHSLADLLSILPEDVVGDMAGDIVLLDRFYIPTRYPDALPGSIEDGLPDEDEAQEAFILAKQVLEKISSKLGTV